MGTVPAGSPAPAASTDVMTCPHQVAHKCLLNREKRMGIDLVNDDVEKQLITVSVAAHIMCQSYFYLNSPKQVWQPCSLTGSSVLVRC